MALLNGLVVMTPSTVDKTGTGSTATINSNGSVTFGSCTSLSLNGVFTSSYDNYMIAMRWQTTTNSTNLYCRLRASGTNATSTADYNYQSLGANGTIIFGTRSTNLGAWSLANADNDYSDGLTMYVFGPKLSQPTAFRTTTVCSFTGAYIEDNAGTHELSSAYDGITLYNITFSGLITVFGFNQ